MVLINRSSSRLPDVDYAWLLDGAPAANGPFSPAGGETTLGLPEHRIRRVRRYAKHYDDRPDIEVTADGEGRARLGPNPFSADGRFVHSDVGYSNLTVIVRVEHDGKVGFGFLEAADFNFEYWRGHTDLGHYEFRVPQI